MKTDGHTHTGYCYHGSGETTEEFVIRAIELGFDSYSFTEHPPLPSTFKDQLSYSKEVIDGIAMKETELDSYIKEMHVLKEKYKDRIQLKVGLEVDYLPDHLDWTKHLLKEYGAFLDDSLLSLHFLKGKGGFRCVDLNPKDYKEGLIEYYGSFDDVVTEYLRVMEEQIQEDIGPYKPRRIGHFTLFQIFQSYFFNERYSFPETINKKLFGLLNLIKQKNYSLDFNMAGFFKTYCQEAYPPKPLALYAHSIGIELVYGSDSHAVKDIGREYDYFKSIVE